MGAFTYETSIVSQIPAAKMFNAGVVNADTLIPKIMPEAIKSVEILEGDGGVGTIKVIHFGENGPFKSVGKRVDAIDSDNLRYGYSIIGGDALGGMLESITYRVEVVPKEDGGCICKVTGTYHGKEGVEVDEEKIKVGENKAVMMFKAIEGYLLANPEG
ncbi:major pollen allergen Aln g 1 [Striga asiatica]|uniref:Major pollen allergen Aln g 1 n=1 Tax=Striga asiatica TaxID=4170 RepID=A0A5A7R3I2_STRAF|nr:major pollen allergen Aln g 1 [Striga asiatica]